MEGVQFKILQVVPFWENKHGGTERYCYELSQKLAKKHEVHIFTSKLSRSTPSYQIKNGIHVNRFYAPKVLLNSNPLSLILPKLLTTDFDVAHVHSHLYLPSNQTMFAKIVKKFPVLLHLHGGIGNPPFNIRKLYRTIKLVYDSTLGKFTMKIADVIASVSKRDLEETIKQFGLNRKQTVVIPNAVNIQLFDVAKRFPKNPPQIIYIGDLEPWKGVSYLIHAIRILSRNGFNGTLLIVGDGSYRTYLENMANGLPVKFLGHVHHSKIPYLLAESSVLVLPSLWEGLPTVILEAMAANVPVIATNVGGTPELVRNMETGILISPKRPKALANAIRTLLTNEPLSNKLANEGYQLVTKKFDFVKVCSYIQRIYRKFV